MRPLTALSSRIALLAGVLLLGFAVELSAQERTPFLRADGRAGSTSFSSSPVQPVQDTAQSPPASPGGAFLRSLVVPGWGQATVGSYTRAGFYFGTSSATVWMLVKTARALGEAEAARDLVEDEVAERLRRAGVPSDSIPIRVEESSAVEERQELVESRSQQLEDWAAFGLFWLLLNGADAFVAAHLWDFPEPVEVEWAPVSPAGRSELRLRVPVGAR